VCLVYNAGTLGGIIDAITNQRWRVGLQIFGLVLGLTFLALCGLVVWGLMNSHVVHG